MDSSFKHQQEVEELAKQVKQKTATEKNQDESVSKSNTRWHIEGGRISSSIKCGGKIK
jgi:hypothetical protein